MAHALFEVSIGDQVFVGNGAEEVGAVRQVEPDRLVVYIEGAGDFEVAGPTVLAARNGKVVLDPHKLEPKLEKAIANAHTQETDDID